MFEPWQLSLISELRVARLATIGRSGAPHLVPVCYALVEGRLAIAVDEKPKRPGKLERVRNIERDARVTLLFDRCDDDWEQLAWVRVEGRAELLGTGSEWPEALKALRARYRQYAGMSLESLPIMAIAPEHVAGWRWTEG
jgi:PPOX class probable F420-dependent enzyme